MIATRSARAGVLCALLAALTAPIGFATGGAGARPVTSAVQDLAGTRAAPGDIDTSFGGFGTLGKAVVDIGRSDSRASAVAVQADGKVVVAGSASDTGTDFDFVVARFTSDGRVDPGFGEAGIVRTDFRGTNDQASAVALQPDGKIVAAGFSGGDFALVRYTADGRLDTSFGGDDGIVTTDFAGGADNLAAVALAPGGKIVAAGSPTAPSTEFAVVRYTSNGSLDTAFDGDGKALTLFGGNARANAAVVQADGRIVVAGCAASGAGSFPRFALARYDTNGSLDPAFGGGKITAVFGLGAQCAHALAIGPGGLLAAAGTAFTGRDNDFAVVRYLG